MLRTALRWKSFYQLPLTLPHKQLHLPGQCCAWIDNNISSEFWEKLSKANHQRLSRGLGMQLEKQTNSETQRGGKHEKATVLRCVWPKTPKIGQSNRWYLLKTGRFPPAVKKKLQVQHSDEGTHSSSVSSSAGWLAVQIHSFLLCGGQ